MLIALIVKILIVITCAVLNFFGGYKWHNDRRYVMPGVLSAGFWFASHVWWVGLGALPVVGILVLGYGPKSLLYKYLNDAGARGTWLFLVACVLGAVSFFSGHICWYFYIPYCILAGVMGATLRNLNQIAGDLIEGAYIASIIFFVK